MLINLQCRYTIRLKSRMAINEEVMKRFIIVAIMLLTSFSYADDGADFLSMTVENDAFVRDDGLYSSGLIATWGYNDVERLDKQTLPDWLAYVAQKSYLSTQQDKRYSISYSVAHLLQTAIEISVEELIEEDAPYVGMLAWKGKLSAYDQLMIDQLSFTLGMVGPAAGAEFVQEVTHAVIGASAPRGWDNQIGNEPVFRVQAERLWRIYDNTLADTEFDVITGVNGGIGNLRSNIAAGVGLRWGQDLQSNFSSAPVFPLQKLNHAHYSPYGWYFFANASAFYVANDIFIDGNTCQDSHSVDLIHQQLGASVGVMANIYNWNVVYTVLQLSDQYHGQNERSRFGSIAITYYF